jgi:hypothetical protein
MTCKKLVLLIMTAIVLMPTFTYASGSTNNIFQYIDPYVTVEFDEENDFPDETKQRIADQFAGIVSAGQIAGDDTANILCTLFGHKTSETIVGVTHHFVYAHDPRCREDYYNVIACSRCDYTVDEYLTSMDVYCHPENSEM